MKTVFLFHYQHYNYTHTHDANTGKQSVSASSSDVDVAEFINLFRFAALSTWYVSAWLTSVVCMHAHYVH